MKVKIFIVESYREVESMINAWLAANLNVLITKILQSESVADDVPWSLTITIFYLDNNQDT